MTEQNDTVTPLKRGKQNQENTLMINFPRSLLLLLFQCKIKAKKSGLDSSRQRFPFTLMMAAVTVTSC